MKGIFIIAALLLPYLVYSNNNIQALVVDFNEDPSYLLALDIKYELEKFEINKVDSLPVFESSLVLTESEERQLIIGLAALDAFDIIESYFTAIESQPFMSSVEALAHFDRNDSSDLLLEVMKYQIQAGQVYKSYETAKRAAVMGDIKAAEYVRGFHAFYGCTNDYLIWGEFSASMRSPIPGANLPAQPRSISDNELIESRLELRRNPEGFQLSETCPLRRLNLAGR